VRGHAIAIVEDRLRPLYLVAPDDPLGATASRLDPAQLAEAAALADKLQAQWFPTGIRSGRGAPRPTVGKIAPAAYCERDD
ncbi:MAG: hypothetical protein ACREO3_07185, partial [Arenimonas sp.]